MELFVLTKKKLINIFFFQDGGSWRGPATASRNEPATPRNEEIKRREKSPAKGKFNKNSFTVPKIDKHCNQY